MNVEIRDACESDLAGVTEVFAEENRHHAARLPDIFRVAEPVITLEWLRDVLADPDRSLVVAEEQGRIIGVLLMSLRKTPENPIYLPRRDLYIDEMAVCEKDRRRGIGRMLVDRALAWAREAGAKEVFLDVWERNPEAIAFYDALGFRPTQRRMAREVGDP